MTLHGYSSWRGSKSHNRMLRSIEADASIVGDLGETTRSLIILLQKSEQASVSHDLHEHLPHRVPQVSNVS